MYYNSNNNDYYNAYKKELEEIQAYKKEELTLKVIKVLLLLLTFVLILLAAIYLYKYFNPNIDTSDSSMNQKKVSISNNLTPKIIIREEELPKSIQFTELKREVSEGTSNKRLLLKEKDIALIVQIIMSQMNTKVEKTLEEELNDIDDTPLTHKTLEEVNHYNKIAITETDTLNKELNDIISEEYTINSSYQKEIKKEVFFRQDEMRFIVVQKGDTLSKIAKKAYGNLEAYSKILVANPEIIQNPNQIFVGQRLRIPS